MIYHMLKVNPACCPCTVCSVCWTKFMLFSWSQNSSSPSYSHVIILDHKLVTSSSSGVVVFRVMAVSKPQGSDETRPEDIKVCVCMCVCECVCVSVCVSVCVCVRVTLLSASDPLDTCHSVAVYRL